MNLFNIYHGEFLEIDEPTHISLRGLFPEVDLQSAYRDADAWIFAAAKSRRPRNHRRFIVNWLKNAKRFERNAEYVLADGVVCKVTASDRRTGRIS
jgi:hypothetical protein